MPVKTLKQYTLAEVSKHKSSSSCWIIHENKVYDVTNFMQDHPGGEDLILDYAGKDVTTIMANTLQHEHSDSAYDILTEYLIGEIANSDRNGMVNGFTKDTLKGDTNGTTNILENRKTPKIVENNNYTDDDFTESFHPDVTDTSGDYSKSKFLDLSKPLFAQLYRSNFSKAFYLKQVHQPRYVPYPAPLFGNFLEVFTRTKWYVIPTLWLPWVGYNIYLSLQAGGNLNITIPGFAMGVFIWTLLEYGLHRFLFHLDDLLPDNRFAILLHFSLHGIHHYIPMDRERLVMPPVLAVIIGTPLVKLAYTLFRPALATAVIAGAFFGYILYDCTHYYLHHARPFGSHFREMKKYHIAHHYKNYESGYGITSKLWDYVFGTVLEYK